MSLQPVRSHPHILSGALQSTVEEWWQEQTWAGRVAEKALSRGRIMAASPICSDLLLGIACSTVAADSYWPCVWQQLLVPHFCPSTWDAEQKFKRYWGWISTGTPSLCLDMLGLGFQTGPPEHARPPLGHKPPATLLLMSCSSAHLYPAPQAFGEQKHKGKQTFAKRDRSTFSSWSSVIANLGEKVGVELIQGTVCSCMKMHS